MLALLGVQFLTGMFVNLYVHVPQLRAGPDMMEMMRVGAIFPVHMMMGILIGVGSMVTLVLALSRGRKVVVLAALGAAGTFIAGVGGLRFLMAGQANGSSYLMATGFLVVVVGYVGELIVASIWH